jgi:hypothetical protein
MPRTAPAYSASVVMPVECVLHALHVDTDLEDTVHCADQARCIGRWNTIGID